MSEELFKKDHRCKNCDKLLFKGEFSGTIKVKCTKCKIVSEFDKPLIGTTSTQ